MQTSSDEKIPLFAKRERKLLSFQLGLPFGIFVVAVITLLLAATYIVQDRSSASTKIIPQTHADSIALRVEQAVEHSISVASIISRLARTAPDAERLEVIHTLMNSDPAILSVAFVNKELETIWKINAINSDIPEDFILTKIPSSIHFEKAIPWKEGVSLQVIHFPVYGKTGEVEGVLAVSYDVSAFWEILADYTDGDAYIVDSAGSVLLRRGINIESTSTISQIEGVQNFLDRKHVVSTYLEEDGVGMLSAWSIVRMPGWAIVVEEPIAKLYDQLRALYAFIGFLIFIIAFLFVIEVITVKRKIFTPLHLLEENAKKIASGESNTWVGTDANNEFDTVGEAMNTMARNVQTLRHGLEERIAERTEHLRAKTEEAERLNTFMVNRELRMTELKAKIKKLEEELGKRDNKE
ncbi:MAG TPA: hypothetical protein VJ579_04620 [Candidatus Paceibacterota bacterium]|nr:hypothetical protein [Candidatus Paceibacterota bacterium]